MTNGPESADAPRRSRRAAGSTAEAGHQERESQQRARDRETLRAYKALTDSRPRPEESDANPPTRRQLRIAQQQTAQAARAALAGQATESGLATEAGRAAESGQATEPGRAAGVNRAAESGQATEPGRAAGVNRAAAADRAPEGNQAADEQSPSTAVRSGRRSGASTSRNPGAGQAPESTADEPRPSAEASRSRAATPRQEPTRRERRRRAAEDTQGPVVTPVTPAPSRAPVVQAQHGPAAAVEPAPSAGHGTDRASGVVPAQPAPARCRPAGSAPPAPGATADDPETPASAAVDRRPVPDRSATSAPDTAAVDNNADVADMSVEQALAAREALKHQARNQVAAMEALQQADPHAVDLELLAQQRALAERAAVLNRRTQNIQRLAQENEQRRSPQSDPTTAHNLAMVTPLEFVEVPGVGRPVMKPPATSHVPVITSSNPEAAREPAGRTPGPGRKAPARRPEQENRRAGRTQASADVRHSKILARADALLNAPLEEDQGAKPIGARSAFGLDPLDVMTAGLGRTRRLRAAALGIVGVGLAALILGVIMIVGGLGS